LVSPERLLISGQVEQVLVPGAEGDMTVLAHHAPVLTTLRPGVLDIGMPGGEHRRYFIRGGFAEIGPAGLTVLAETAIDLIELDAGQLAQAVQDAEEDVTDAAVGALRDRAQTRLDHLRQVQSALKL
jgi:F-type H+-transporting ATPase subunit epsilon